MSDEEERAERFADRFRAVYLAFHRRDGPPQSVISEIVSHLEEQGLLERESDPADRRRTLVWLTQAGHSALRRDREVLGLDLLGRALARLPAGRADELIAGLQDLVQAAGPTRQGENDDHDHDL